MIAVAGLVLIWALAQSTDGQPVTSTVIINDRLVKDATTSPEDSGLIIGAIPVSPAEAARRQAVDTNKTRALKVYRDRTVPNSTETVISAKDVVVSTTPNAGAACVQIGAVGAQANCRTPKP